MEHTTVHTVIAALSAMTYSSRYSYRLVMVRLRVQIADFYLYAKSIKMVRIRVGSQIIVVFGHYYDHSLTQSETDDRRQTDAQTQIIASVL